MDKSVGWFVEPTIVVTTDPSHRLMKEEIFGPILTIYVYDDAEVATHPSHSSLLSHVKMDATLDLVNASDYSLTGAVFARDREAIEMLDHKVSCPPSVLFSLLTHLLAS